MKSERITYTGAYQYVMVNRGYDGNYIFADNKNKNHFPDYLEDSANKMHIRLFSYCIMEERNERR